MFISYDLDSFGKEVRRIRKKCNMSQKYVSEITCIHIDTLRKLENGYTIPKYETLEILAKLYKTDLLLVLKEKRIDANILNFYTLMDDILVNNTIEEIELLDNKFTEFIKSVEFNNMLITKIEIDQLKCFLEVCKLFFLGNPSSLNIAKCKIVGILTLSNNNFDVNCFNDFQYTEIELRLLCIYGTIEMIQKNYLEAIDFFTYIVAYLIDYHYDTKRINQLIIKSFNNISYCYHLEDNHLDSLKYANIGIQFALNHQLLYMLHNLFGRKTIAEKLLNLDAYMESYRKCLTFLDLLDNEKLLSTYKCTFKEMYNIY